MDQRRRNARVPMRGNADNRQTLRKAVEMNARLRDRSAARFAIRVIDLSRTGFRAETAFALNAGSIVWITLPGLAGLEAEVAWQRGIHVGCAFRQPLHVAVFDHICRLAH